MRRHALRAITLIIVATRGLLGCNLDVAGGASDAGAMLLPTLRDGANPLRDGATSNPADAGTSRAVDGDLGDDQDAGDSPRPSLVPLYDESTELEPEIWFDRGDAVVTRFADRGRDRHAREDQFQSYDHYLPHYWEHRTARYIFVDYVAKGGSTIELSYVSEWELDRLPEFRAWYLGTGTVAHYSGNYGPLIEREGPGLYDNEHRRIGEGTQYKYTYTISSAIDLNGEQHPLEVGQFMEFESSLFLNEPPVGRDNYYGTTFLYEVGRGGLVPWRSVGDFADQSTERENSHKIDERGWLGGRTTLSYQYSDEPDNHYMQMATNLSSVNGQHFVSGRRVHHTNMLDGTHDESAENGVYQELVGLAGPRFNQPSCDACHTRNGRAAVAPIGAALDRWVFKIADANGAPDPQMGSVLQSQESRVSIAEWVERDGLRSPRYRFEGPTPALFSGRIAPALVGMGLLEAIAEDTIVALADPDDRNEDGISGRVQISADPRTGEPRLGRFGWKAGTSSLSHQIAAALNNDMGVTTSLYPRLDCGSVQTGCEGAAQPELSDIRLEELRRYVALLGVRARRDLDDETTNRGEAVFGELGCTSCHIAEMTTGSHHPFAELRNQVIHPYTDLLLHDMGEGLADALGEREASGAEWRTTALWGIGLSPCVTGGVEGQFQHQVCAPSESYLHDGRARTLDEAIRWHGGEAQASTARYLARSEADRAALIRFLRSL